MKVKFTPEQLEEIQAMRDRLRREHNKELHEAQTRYYQLGLREGREKFREELLTLLGISFKDNSDD